MKQFQDFIQGDPRDGAYIGENSFKCPYFDLIMIGYCNVVFLSITGSGQPDMTPRLSCQIVSKILKRLNEIRTAYIPGYLRHRSLFHHVRNAA